MTELELINATEFNRLPSSEAKSARNQQSPLKLQSTLLDYLENRQRKRMIICITAAVSISTALYT